MLIKPPQGKESTILRYWQTKLRHDALSWLAKINQKSNNSFHWFDFALLQLRMADRKDTELTGVSAR